MYTESAVLARFGASIFASLTALSIVLLIAVVFVPLDNVAAPVIVLSLLLISGITGCLKPVHGQKLALGLCLLLVPLTWIAALNNGLEALAMGSMFGLIPILLLGRWMGLTVALAIFGVHGIPLFQGSALNAAMNLRLALEHFLVGLLAYFVIRALERIVAELDESKAELATKLIELEQSKETLEQAAVTAKVVTYEYDLASDTVVLSDYAKEIFQVELSTTESLRGFLPQFFDQSEIHNITNRISEMLSSNQVANFTLSGKNGRGDPLVLKVSGKSLSRGGKPVGLYGTFTDITDLEKAYERKQKAQIQLTEAQHQSELISEKEIYIQQLKDSQAKRSQLFGMVAHELRTPVAAISMMADHFDDSDWINDRKNIKQSAKDLLSTIDDMRLLLNPDLKRPIRPEAFSVGELNAAVASSVASIVASTGVQYQQFNAIPLLMNDEEFLSDTYRARVAITNIVKNACLHSKGTQVWMLSRVYIRNEGEHFLDWVIIDNGVGIPKEQVERLFLAGERGDSPEEGSGFGLYITKTWIEEIGGEVVYRPHIQGGSEFVVRIPLKLAQKVGTEISADSSEATSLTNILPHLKILMVEDEPMLRMLGQKILVSSVSDVITAENGRVALDKLDDSFNLILTDYFMPEMSGVEFTAKLRESGYKGVIVGVTAATIGEQRQEMLDSGVDMVLPKPLNREMFNSAISELLSKGRFDDLLNEIKR